MPSWLPEVVIIVIAGANIAIPRVQSTFTGCVVTTSAHVALFLVAVVIAIDRSSK
jgi:hypothetical protein